MSRARVHRNCVRSLVGRERAISAANAGTRPDLAQEHQAIADALEWLLDETAAPEGDVGDAVARLRHAGDHHTMFTDLDIILAALREARATATNATQQETMACDYADELKQRAEKAEAEAARLRSMVARIREWLGGQCGLVNDAGECAVCRLVDVCAILDEAKGGA